MAECSVCRQFSPFIASAIRVCRRCLLERPEDALIIVRESHARARTGFGLPPSPPKSSRGVACNLCAAACVIPEGGLATVAYGGPEAEGCGASPAPTMGYSATILTPTSLTAVTRGSAQQERGADPRGMRQRTAQSSATTTWRSSSTAAH